MKPQEEKQKFAEGEGAIKKPRFKIEKLEERIAPRCFRGRFGRYVNCYGHYNPHGKYVGAGKP